MEKKNTRTHMRHILLSYEGSWSGTICKKLWSVHHVQSTYSKSYNIKMNYQQPGIRFPGQGQCPGSDRSDFTKYAQMFLAKDQKAPKCRSGLQFWKQNDSRSAKKAISSINYINHFINPYHPQGDPERFSNALLFMLRSLKCCQRISLLVNAYNCT